MTDESAVYPTLGDDFARHYSVNHSKGEYVDHGGYAHTNTVESHFALLKRGVYGTFHSLSEAHLHRYLARVRFQGEHAQSVGQRARDRSARWREGQTPSLSKS